VARGKKRGLGDKEVGRALSGTVLFMPALTAVANPTQILSLAARGAEGSVAGDGKASELLTEIQVMVTHRDGQVLVPWLLLRPERKERETLHNKVKTGTGRRVRCSEGGFGGRAGEETARGASRP
jgi:hypothetical protein